MLAVDVYTAKCKALLLLTLTVKVLVRCGAAGIAKRVSHSHYRRPTVNTMACVASSIVVTSWVSLTITFFVGWVYTLAGNVLREISFTLTLSKPNYTNFSTVSLH